MFTIPKKPNYSYLRKLMILPLLSFLTVFFSFKIKGQTLQSETTSGKTSAISRSSNNETDTKTLSSSIDNSDTTEARFPGGNEAWKKFLETNLDANVAANDKAPTGIYTVKLEFIVSETGEIKNISATKIPDRCPSCAVEAVRAIKTGPKWDPMTIKGKKVMSQLVQFVSLQVAEK